VDLFLIIPTNKGLIALFLNRELNRMRLRDEIGKKTLPKAYQEDEIFLPFAVNQQCFAE
jgi:hypothetical protein